MLNRELIIEKYNDTFGASLDAWDDNIIEGFVDLEVLGITDDMMLKCIEDKVFTKDEELLDPTLIGIVKTLKSGLIKNLEKDDINMIVNKFTGKSDRWSEAFCEIARG